MKIAKVVLCGNIVKIAEKLNLSLADAFMVEQYRDVDCVGIENRFFWIFRGFLLTHLFYNGIL